MTKCTTVNSSNTMNKLRAGGALLLLGGSLVLSSCATAPENTAPDAAPSQSDTSNDSGASSDAGAANADSSASSAYQDGSYTADGTYRTPGGVEQISVTVDLNDGVIDSVSVAGDPRAPESQQYQGQFISGISEVVVGKSIDEISVDRVAGSSLTSGGFNDAIEQIKTQARG